MNSRLKKFIGSPYEVAAIIVAVIGFYMIYKRNQYFGLAYSALGLILAIQSIVKKELNLRGKVYKKTDNPALYYGMILLYIIFSTFVAAITLCNQSK